VLFLTSANKAASNAILPLTVLTVLLSEELRPHSISSTEFFDLPIVPPKKFSRCCTYTLRNCYINIDAIILITNVSNQSVILSEEPL